MPLKWIIFNQNKYIFMVNQNKTKIIISIIQKTKKKYLIKVDFFKKN